MPNPDLRTAMANLDEALAHADSLDDERRERVRRALLSLHEALEDSEAAPRAEHKDDLFDLAEHFAEEHPSLASALGRVVDILSKMGI